MSMLPQQSRCASMAWRTPSMLSPLEELFTEGVRKSYAVRDAQTAKQAAAGAVDAGTRGAVTGGAHMDAMAEVLEEIFVENGIPRSAVKRSNGVEIPGYYRPTKKGDLVVTDGESVVDPPLVDPPLPPPPSLPQSPLAPLPPLP